MKRTLACSLLAASSVLVLPPALAQPQGTGGMDMKGTQMKGDPNSMDMKPEKKAKSQTHKGSGTVSKIDAGKGTVTIAHGPVSTMNWPAMTMSFKAKDKALLEKVKPGDKVDFEFVQQGRDYVVTAVK